MSEPKAAAMWKLYAATQHEVMGEQVIDDRVFQADSLLDLVRQAQAFMDNRSGLVLFVPYPDNPYFSLDQYGELIGADIEGSRDRTIKGHFAVWVRYDRIVVRPLYTYKRGLRFKESE